MKHLGLLALVLLLFYSGAVFAADEASPQAPIFTEFWNSVAFYDTNLEKNNYSSILGRFEGKVGLNLGQLPVQVYGVYYSAASQIEKYWDNYLYAGAGMRLFPFRGYQANGWYNEWLPDVRVFVESLTPTYLKNAVSAESLAKNDARYGVEVWHEWNQVNPDVTKPWGELWAKADYRTTNFGWEDFTSYIIYLQPKYGIYLDEAIKVYWRGDVTYSHKSGPSYSFLNIADYGVGIRFEPFRNRTQPAELLHKFNMFAEVLGVSYLKEQPATAGNVVSSDVRFGVDLSYGR
ncbi:hypothetical protein A3H38_02150 [candidate division WOR-1 bacterium RIFCSPLOWO2_02_FULL_46_20]|uniref:Uncharacterized protein n=2 Tax=Saganbacteria TaxID=1703751 RepID=A0A1F4RAC8_UNCSA|nr:MAG: hypothetical protein A3J44_00175 [candidate division WOR-1 bacterium RIFCSPHIGHO2_02_FULL_45_12]OGC04483.1 MAG: hypothetical protein A3H38_02150 [candidate division WOR-1 bacterium RIFCSPLOWO2_02_FULL_46_20]OGC10149.1 MAG: hypothetical protein A3F86_06135 [candidate division WOR-1 bacterium RIFCSPLOWO2_12_FULL_45_9]